MLNKRRTKLKCWFIDRNTITNSWNSSLSTDGRQTHECSPCRWHYYIPQL